MRRELSFWLLVILLATSLISLGYVTAANAGESTIILSDNTRITTREIYPVIPTTTHNLVEPVISNPIAQHDCFDRIKLLRNKASRYQAIDQCIQGVAA